MDAFFDAPPNLQVLPTTRAAYSDRTAWMMSEMSALAYLKFEGDKSFHEILGLISALGERTLRKKGGNELSLQLKTLETRVLEYIDQRITTPPGSPAGLREIEQSLDAAGFALVETFDEGGTQAFLATRDADNVAVLAFRGTEATSWKDVQTDIKFRFYTGKHGVKTHTGFREAYQKVAAAVQSAVDRHAKDHTLYITGHSLGGALAIIAAKRLERDTLAACYTFGSPRVGNLEFAEEIRAPIYRVVNAADGVPRVPPSWTARCVAFVVSFFRPHWGDWIEKRFCGYLHQGDMRYLTACDGDLSKLKVIPNLSMPFRAWRMAWRMITNGPKVAGADHRINEYRKKLLFYATRRAGLGPQSNAAHSASPNQPVQP